MSSGSHGIKNMPTQSITNTTRATKMLAVAVGWLLVVSDGYDLIVYGTVRSSLINKTGWELTNATAGTGFRGIPWA